MLEWKWFLVIATLLIGEEIRRKDFEKFKKIMTDALSYTLSIGIIFSFLETLGSYNIQLFGLSFDFAWNLSPIKIMSAICALFLASFAINYRKRSASKSTNENLTKCKKTIA